MPNSPFGSHSKPSRKKRSRPTTRAKRTKTFDSVEHLSAEAVAGYVDNELPPSAMKRAQMHLVHCPECRAEVVAQRNASDRLRQSAEEEIVAPTSLVNRLASLAQSCPEGPEAEELAPKRGENLVAKVETFYRAVKKAQGK